MIHRTWLLAVAVAGGCSSASPFDDRLYERRVQFGAERATRMDTPSADLLPDNAGVDDYVRYALRHNPSIRAAEHRVAQARHSIPQVTALDDPMLEVAPVGEMAQTAAGEVGLMTGISQRVPLSGRLDTRGRIAEQDVRIAQAGLERTRQQVEADARRAYWNYAYAARAIAITLESLSLLSAFHEIARAQYAAGSRNQQDVLLASIELAGVDTELIELRRQQSAAHGMLNTLMNRPVAAPLPQPPAQQETVPVRELDELLAQASEHNPALRAAHERIGQLREQRQLAKDQRIPDLTVGLVYNVVDDEGLSMAANGEDQWWIRFGISLPIWAEKYDAAEDAAAIGVLGGIAELHAEQNRVSYQVQDAHLKLKAQQDLVALFTDTILPEAQQTIDSALAGYRSGSVDMLTMLDAWRSLLDYQLMLERARTQMHQAWADLQQAVGAPLTDEGSDDETH